VGTSAAAFIRQVMALPAGVLFRHCVAGDQWPDPADPLRIDQVLLLQLARATRHLRAAWSYTHFPMGPVNQSTLRLAAAQGLVVNASTESRSIAAGLQRQGIPAVCVVPPDSPAVFRHQGVRFVACPATRPGSGVQCSSCGGRWGLPLCAQAARTFVITFPAHGARAAAASPALQLSPRAGWMEVQQLSAWALHADRSRIWRSLRSSPQPSKSAWASGKGRTYAAISRHRGGRQTAPGAVFSNIPNPPLELQELRLKLREVLAKIGYCMAAGMGTDEQGGCYVTT
jgi:hypothetical protein